MRRFWDNLLILFAVVLICIIVAAVSTRLAAPSTRMAPPSGTRPPDYKSFAATVTPAAIESDLRAIAACGSRFTGSLGCDRAAAYLTMQLESAGFTVTQQPVPVTVPVTQRAYIADESGMVIPGIRLEPMLPNWFRTATVPESGIVGRIVHNPTGRATDFAVPLAAGDIVLMPIGTPWSMPAQMGAVAVLYYDSSRKIVPGTWEAHADASINIPRFLLGGPPEQIIKTLAGRRMRIFCRVDFEERIALNITAFLADPPAVREAVIVNAPYDAFSYAPDNAPGAEQSAGVASLLSMARHLAKESREFRRGVVLLLTPGHAQGLFGARQFASALGQPAERDGALRDWRKRHAEAQSNLDIANDAFSVVSDDYYWRALSPDVERNYWARPSFGQAATTSASPETQATTVPESSRRSQAPTRASDVRAYVDSIVARVLDDRRIHSAEATLEARVAWVRAGMPVHGEHGEIAPLFETYNNARAAEQAALGLLSLSSLDLRRTMATGHEKPGTPDWGVDLRRRTAAEATARIAHAQRKADVASAQQQLAERLTRYERVLFLGLDLTSRSDRFALVCGEPGIASDMMPADAELRTQVLQAEQGLSAAEGRSYAQTASGQARFVNLVRERDSEALAYVGRYYGAPTAFESLAVLMRGHPSFTFATLDDDRARMGSPSDTFELMLAPEVSPLTKISAVDNLLPVTRLITATVSQWARGEGRIVPISRSPASTTIRGRVVSRAGDSLTPSSPMPGALVRFGPPQMWGAVVQPPHGVGRDMIVTADHEGRFELEVIWASAITLDVEQRLDIDAAIVSPNDGQVTWSLSAPQSGPGSSFAVRGVQFSQFKRTPATAVVFRATPIQVFPVSDPTTLRPYAGFDLLDANSLASPKEFKVESSPQGNVCFVPPDTRLYFAFKSGRRDNPALMEVRAFALGMTNESNAALDLEDKEVSGPGYLAADTPSVTQIERDLALSMASVNARRVALQQRSAMADEMTVTYSRKATELAADAVKAANEGHPAEARRMALDSIAYSSNIHRVILQNASDAVVGILFYLVLVVPFAFVMEKLLIGHPDIRHQLVYQSAIFLIYFLALRAVHPAYALVRSSTMILLGFITFSLAIAVVIFLSARFSRSFADLHRRFQQRAEAIDVSRAGAAATAFMLGINNMRKRPMRTAMTVGTLVLVTFVMICFASVSTQLVDIEFSVGKASYTGLLIRDRNLGDVGPALAPLREEYGERQLVAPRAWGGSFEPGWQAAPERASISVTHTANGVAFESSVAGVLGLSTAEAKVTPVHAVCSVLTRWFERDDESACFLPRGLAEQLHVTDAEVRSGKAIVRVSGQDLRVLGIFEEDRIEAMVDLDGQSLLPLDVLALRNMSGATGGAVARRDAFDVPEDVSRLPARQVIITSIDSMPTRNRIVSVAVAFRPQDYATSRQLVQSNLERTGTPMYYGLDGVAFYGGYFRLQTVDGVLELILPIILSVLTVFNTMRGSVYERKNELFVFNAVGLSPTHIRWLFLAEAAVYAVVGAVGGYLFAQTIGALLKLAGTSAGLSINYSSLSAVLVSVLIMGVVMLSSLYPAYVAARLAAPAESLSRRRSAAVGDVLEVDLPFIFSGRERVGIVPFFTDWFEDYGEGSAGEFFCSRPTTRVRMEADGRVSPVVETIVWLKPYDLGLSQLVELVVRHDPNTGDNVATVVISRLTGEHEAWERSSHAFVGLLRRRFLEWRAISDEDHNLLFERGRQVLAARLGVKI